MTKKQLSKLSRGDIVKPRGGETDYVVHYNYGDRATAVKTVDLTNPSEWDLVRKARFEEV